MGEKTETAEKTADETRDAAEGVLHQAHWTPEEARELVHRPGDATGSLRLAEQAWSAEHREQVAAFLGEEPDSPFLVPFLAISAQYQLDPFLREIWLIDTTKRVYKNGSWQDGPRTLTPAIGRDGFLKVARRTPEYEGFQANVVCAKDEFRVAYTGRDDDPQIHHVQAMDLSAGDSPADWRGPVLGAWAKVFVRGKKPTYYFAPLKEHGKLGERDNGDRYWKGAWSYTSSMITKAAVSYTHRLAIGVTGVLPVDEMRPDGTSLIEGQAEEETPEEDRGAAEREAINALDLPLDLREEITAAVERVNELAPFSWAASKISMMLTGRDEDGARAILREIRRDIDVEEKREAERVAAEAKREEARAAEEAADREAAEAIVVMPLADLEPGALVLLSEDVVDEVEQIEKVPAGEDPGDVEHYAVVFRDSGLLTYPLEGTVDLAPPGSAPEPDPEPGPEPDGEPEEPDDAADAADADEAPEL